MFPSIWKVVRRLLFISSNIYDVTNTKWAKLTVGEIVNKYLVHNCILVLFIYATPLFLQPNFDLPVIKHTQINQNSDPKRKKNFACIICKIYIIRILLSFLLTDTRESAFVYAITAAGVTFAVTEACNMGKLLQCSCDNRVQDITTDGEWVWGGCSDNINFGYRKSKDFMDARKRKRRGDLTTRIQLHNNEAGRSVGIHVPSMGFWK